MWCLPCLKPSTKEDSFESELAIAKAVSEHEHDSTRQRRLEEEHLVALAIRESLDLAESSRRRQLEEEEEKRRAREIEKDAQIARGFHYEERERERQLDDASALEAREKQLIAKAVEESLKEENKRKQTEYEQVKKDEQIAKDLFLSEMAIAERSRLHGETVLDDEDAQIAVAVANSLKDRGKGKQVEYEQGKKDAQESLNNVEPSPRLAENENFSTRAPLDKDVELDQALRESLEDKGKGKQPKDEVEDDEKLPDMNPPPRSMCGGCNFEIEPGESVDVLGVLWHPECLLCNACHRPIAIHEIENHVSNSRGNFHKACYGRYCYVCEERVKIRSFNQHPFWKENYCPAHDSDKTPKCCSCERLQPKGTNFGILDDGRSLCLECMESAVMDTDEVQPLHFEIREYFEGLYMKIEKEFPFLLVEKQALNQAEKEEKIVSTQTFISVSLSLSLICVVHKQDYQYEVVTRGICLSEAQTVRSVSKGPNMGTNKQRIDIRTKPQEIVRTCEVTAILILYGFPRVLTGYILAHEMMHAYLRLNGHKVKNTVLEEGICQVLGHMWLESQRYAPVEDEASSSASVSRTPAAGCASKKGKCSDFERKLVEFCKNQIETDESPAYGVGFRTVHQMMVSNDYSIKDILKKIVRRV